MKNRNKDIRLRLVGKLVYSQANWVIGGWENSVTDGHIDAMPPREEMEAQIYDGVINATYVELAGGLRPIKTDIRFLGTAKIKEMITQATTKILAEG